jgi:hypothetical protein
LIHFTETEAAAELGITVEELRELVRKHISDGIEDLSGVVLSRVDVTLLRYLASK